MGASLATNWRCELISAIPSKLPETPFLVENPQVRKKDLIVARQFASRGWPSAMLDTSNQKHFCIPELVIENKTDTALPLQL